MISRPLITFSIILLNLSNSAAFSSSVPRTLEYLVYAFPLLNRAEGLLHKQKLFWLDMICCVKYLLTTMHLFSIFQTFRNSVLN